MRFYYCYTITIYSVDWGKLMKEALIAKCLGNIGALDGVVETGLVGSCKKSDSISVGISSGSSFVSFIAGSFSKSTLGRIGGNILTTAGAVINVGMARH